MNNIKYSIVIPTYKHLDDCLKPCLESIVKTTDLSNVEVIVVANGCGEDGTKEFVESLGESFKLVWEIEPIGYTKATNIGIIKSIGEYVILLNNDCRLLDWQYKSQWINLLEAPFLNDEKMAITGTSKGYDPNFNFWHLIFFCVMIPKKIFDELGLLDEIFNPGAGEDTDFCARVKLAGYKFLQIPVDKDAYEYSTTFPIYHVGGTTMNEISDRTFMDNNNRGLGERYKGKI